MISGKSSIIDITPATLTYHANSTSMVYGNSVPSLSGSVSGFVGSETLANATSGTLAFNTLADNTSHVGAYAIDGAGLAANNGNYIFVQDGANATALSITPRPLNFSGSRVYDSTTTFAAGQLSAGNIVNNDTVNISGSADVASKNVNSYSSFASNNLLVDNSDYQVIGGSVAVNITPATLTYHANSTSMVYGNSVPSLSGSVSGFVGSETLANATSGTLAFNTLADNTSHVGAYAIDGAGLAANNGNYIFVQDGANATALSITPRPLNFSGSRVYDSTTTFAAGQLSAGNIVNNDTVNISGSADVASKNVNNYSSFASNNLLVDNSDYQVIGGSVAVNITPATLTYHANSTSMVYGNSVPSLSGSVSGFVGSETLASATSGTLAFNTLADNTSHVGAYAIDGAGLAANNGNYIFVQDGANATALSITPRPLNFSGSRVYDSTDYFCSRPIIRRKHR